MCDNVLKSFNGQKRNFMKFQELKALMIDTIAVSLRVRTLMSLIFCFLTTWSLAESPLTYSSEGLTWTYTQEGGGIVLRSVLGTLSGKLVMPKKIDGYPVVSIEEELFSGQSAIVTVELPDSLVYIGTRAFQNCTSLERIDIPNGVMRIGVAAFSGCTNLQTVNLPSSMFWEWQGEQTNETTYSPIGASAFAGCVRLQQIKIPNGVKALKSGTFSECSSLSKVVLNDDLVEINALAFNKCISLLQISIPKHVEDVDTAAFDMSGCVVESDGLWYVDNWCLGVSDTAKSCYAVRDGTVGVAGDFSGCSNMTSPLALPDSVLHVKCSLLPSKSQPSWCEIVDGVRYVGNWCLGLSSDYYDGTVSIRAGTIGIVPEAFWGCKYVTAVFLPQSIRSIGESAFYGCKSVRTIVGLDQIESVERSAFRNCESLSGVVEMPLSFGPRIPDWLFAGCAELTGYYFHTSVRYVGRSSFSGCSKLRYFYPNGSVMPGNIYHIDSCAFFNCSKLSPPSFHNLTHIGGKAFDGTFQAANTYALPDTVVYVGANAFPTYDTVRFDGDLKVLCLGEWRIDNAYWPGRPVWIPNWSNYKGLSSVGVWHVDKDYYWSWKDVLGNATVRPTVAGVDTSEIPCHHDHLRLTNAVEATCQRVGYSGDYMCEDCGACVEQGVSLPYASHLEGAGIVRVAPTEDATGLMDYYCECCGALIRTDVLPIVRPSDKTTPMEEIVVLESDVVSGLTRFFCTLALGSGETAKYTVDGSDPASSETACNYTGRFQIPPSVKIRVSIFDFLNRLTAAYETMSGDYVNWIPDIEEGELWEESHASTNAVKIIVPSVVNGVTTYKVRNSAFFENHHNLREVVIPSTVNKLGDMFCSFCPALTNIVLYCQDVEGLGYIMYGCSAVEHIYLPPNLKRLSQLSYTDLPNVKELDLPDGLLSLSLGEWSSWTGFENPYCSVQELVIPNSVTNIQLCGMRNLRHVTIPYGVSYIASSAFRGCGGLSSLTIPEGVVSIGNEAFASCTGLVSVTLPTSIERLGYGLFSGCTGLRSLLLPTGLSHIPDELACGCSALESIEIPSGVESIGSYAFDGCSGLKSLVIPASVTSIGFRAFWGCTDLHDVTHPGWKCDLNFSNLTNVNVVIADGVTNISGSAFSGCKGIASVTIPSSVTSIGSYAFENCSGLTSVTIPSSVTSIGDYAFSGCSGLTSVTIPSSVTSIGSYAFQSCSGLTSVTISEGVTSIGSSAFYGCSGLTSLVIPSSVTSIGSSAFYGCSGLTSLVIPASVTSIDSSAFGGCNDLHDVTLPGWKCGLNFFNLTNVNVVIADGVTNISSYAFSGCKGIASVTIPSSVTRIGSYAFYDCNGLTSVTISSGVTSIGHSAFYGCSGLTSVTIPNSVTSIESYSFYGCSGLTSVTIPNSVASIGNYAFDGCSGLTSLVIPASVTSIGSSAFGGCNGLHDVTLPGWKCDLNFSNLTNVNVVIADGVTNISDSAFSGCKGIASVVMPASLRSIGSYAFQSCSGLTSVTIPSSVTSIGSSAFSGCSGLRTIYVAAGDTSRVKRLYAWPGSMIFVEVILPVVEGDEGATVTGDAEAGFVVKPSEGKTAVEVTIPRGVDAAKVTVEVSPKVESIKPNGAKVKVVVGENDITDYLVIPESDGVMNIAAATVKEEVVKETLDPSKDAVITLNAANPQLITAPTRKGLFYQLREGVTLGGMKDGDSTIGDGQPWSPEITVRGGNSAFYSIGVGKGD